MPRIFIDVTEEEMDTLVHKKGWKTWKEWLFELAGVKQ